MTGEGNSRRAFDNEAMEPIFERQVEDVAEEVLKSEVTYERPRLRKELSLHKMSLE